MASRQDKFNPPGSAGAWSQPGTFSVERISAGIAAGCSEGARMTDTLPPLPLRKVRHVYNESKGYEVDAWLEDEVRAYAIAYAAAAVAAEREACAALCDAQAASLDNPYNRATGAADDLADSAKDCAAAIRTRKP